MHSNHYRRNAPGPLADWQAGVVGFPVLRITPGRNAPTNLLVISRPQMFRRSEPVGLLAECPVMRNTGI